MLEDHARKPDYDLKKLAELREYFKGVYDKLGFYENPKNEVIDTDALVYQVPGGMLSNFRVQLKEQKMEDKFEEVFAEVPYVREKLGWIPLVTPTSQIVGTQAMMNVKFGRWKMFTPQAMDIALGYYGRTPAPVDPEVRALAQKISGKEPIDCRPADLKPAGMEDLRKQLRAKGIKDDDEHWRHLRHVPAAARRPLHEAARRLQTQIARRQETRGAGVRRRSSTSQSTASGSTSKSACSAGLPRSGNAGRKGSAFFLRNADFDVSIFPPMA